MSSRRKRRFEVTVKVFDLILVNVAWWFAYYLRFETNLLPSEVGLFDLYLKFSILVTFLTYYSFRSEGIYTTRVPATDFQYIFSIIKANSFAFLLFIVSSYFLFGHKPSRLFALAYYFLSTLLIVGLKLSIHRVRRRKPKEYLLVGNTKQIQDYAEKITSKPELGIQIKKWLKTDEEIANFKVEDLDTIKPDTIVFADRPTIDISNLLIEVIILPDLSHALVGYQVVNIMSGTLAIIINEPNFKSRSIIIKRIFDFVLCSIGVIIISPLLILIALLVKLTSKGPILYSQVRMGLDGREFKMYKFRSMTVGETNKETWTVKNDPRVTPIGKILRKTSLDELPQLFNVILGDMSLVGPRPERPIFVNEFKQSIPTYMLRHKMKAGITGWAQINGWRGDTSIEKRIECDLYYIKNWSIWMDIWIIFMTFWKGFINKNAY